MKIEIGESLLYSWLRHVKECQIVQTNWKISPQWQMLHTERLNEVMESADKYFKSQYEYEVFKRGSLEQLLLQAEIDVLGISLSGGTQHVFAIDVAFHEGGLNYGDKEETVTRVIKKCIRTVMCLYGYFDITEGSIIFASPKINNSIMQGLLPQINDLETFIRQSGFGFEIRLIANEDFESVILKPILIASDGIADTSELFMRSYQMFQMFTKSTTYLPKEKKSDFANLRTPKEPTPIFADDPLRELKVGQIAQIVLRAVIESGRVPATNIEMMLTSEYSKKTFDIQYPLLVKVDSNYDRARYYATPLHIDGVQYLLCSQWFETDRPYLVRWLKQW